MSRREQFLIYCMQFIGLPYIWGGNDPKVGLDCSGLVQILLAWWHQDPPGDQNAQGLYDLLSVTGLKTYPFTPAEMFGGVLFFGADEKHIEHVAFGIGNGLMIEARGGDHTCTTPGIALARGAKVEVKPATHRKDFVREIRFVGLV